MTPRDDRPTWVERLFGPAGLDDIDPARALALAVLALVHQGQGTDARDLTHQADHLTRWIR